VHDPSVVDQHGEELLRANFGDGLNTRVGAEVGDQGTHLDFGERSCELCESIPTPAHGHEVVALGAEPESEGAADAGGGPGNERQPGHDRRPRFGVLVGGSSCSVLRPRFGRFRVCAVGGCFVVWTGGRDVVVPARVARPKLARFLAAYRD
jgi:hypothetical protein